MTVTQVQNHSYILAWVSEKQTFLTSFRRQRHRFIFGSSYATAKACIILQGQVLGLSFCSLPKQNGSMWEGCWRSQHGWGVWGTHPRKQAGTSGAESTGNPAKVMTYRNITHSYSHCQSIPCHLLWIPPRVSCVFALSASKHLSGCSIPWAKPRSRGRDV